MNVNSISTSHLFAVIPGFQAESRYATGFVPPLEGRQWLSQPSLGIILADGRFLGSSVQRRVASTPTIGPLGPWVSGMAQDISPLHDLHACRLSVHLGQ